MIEVIKIGTLLMVAIGAAILVADGVIWLDEHLSRKAWRWFLFAMAVAFCYGLPMAFHLSGGGS